MPPTIHDMPMDDKQAREWEKIRHKSDWQLQVSGPLNCGVMVATVLSVVIFYLWQWLAPASWPVSIRWCLITGTWVLLPVLMWWSARDFRAMQERRYLLWLEAKEKELGIGDEAED